MNLDSSLAFTGIGFDAYNTIVHISRSQIQQKHIVESHVKLKMLRQLKENQ